GTAVVAPGAQGGYTVEKLATFQAKLATGQDLVWAWSCTAANENGGLRVNASLKRADVFKSIASGATRTAADATPLALTALFKGLGGTNVNVATFGTVIAATFGGPGVTGPTETWIRSTTLAPTFPLVSRQLMPGHPAPTSIEKTAL